MQIPIYFRESTIQVAEEAIKNGNKIFLDRARRRIADEAMSIISVTK